MQENANTETREADRERAPAPGPIAKAPLSPFRLPGDTTPTWEVELLLSGGTLFALLQLPGWLSGVFDYWSVRVGDGALYALSFGQMYAKVIAYAMIAALIAHLLTRGLWVAAIGLRSVYPGGVRWRRLRQGARYRAIARRYVPTLKRLIDRSDDLASQMFAVAALLVVMALFSLVLTGFVFALGWALSASLLGGRYLTEVVLALVAVLISSQIVATLLDRRASARGRHRRRPLRPVLGIFRFQLMMPFARLSQALMLVFTSHFGSVKGSVALVLVMYALIGLAIADVVFQRDPARFGAAGDLHEVAGSRVVSDSHYADRRDGRSQHALTPYIDSARPRGDYLQLVIPFHPRRHPQALESACPGVLEAVSGSADELDEARSRELQDINAQDADAARRERIADIEAADIAQENALADLLECAARLHAPRIGGVEISGLQLQWLTEADDSQPAFTALLPLHELPRGRHLLELNSLPEPASAFPFGRSEERPAGPPLRIPFWR